MHTTPIDSIKLFSALTEINNKLNELQESINISPEWLPRKQVMQFLNYGDTQMAALEKSGSLTITKVGKRKFILRESITHLLNSNIITK